MKTRLTASNKVTSIFRNGSLSENEYKCIEKRRDPCKLEVLKKQFTQRVAASENSSSKVLSLFSQLTLFKHQ